MTPNQPGIELLSAAEVRGILRCSLAYVYKLADRGHLGYVKCPFLGEGTDKPRSMVRFRKSEVYEFIEKNYHPST